jgi:hypothetical protein
MASKLNPTAAEFIPGSFTESYISTDEPSEVSQQFVRKNACVAFLCSLAVSCVIWAIS